ncbi:MAG: M28 family peptidase [candidate division FCPU426 bacterium]
MKSTPPRDATNMKPIEQHVADILQMTGRIIDTCGPRPAGSALSQKAAKILGQALEPFCDRVVLDNFKHRPRAFLGHIALDAALFILACAGVLAGPGWVYPAMALLALGHLINILEFGFYVEFVDFLFKEKTGINVTGTLEPLGEAKQQIVFSAHHDSAYEFTFLDWGTGFYLAQIILSTTVNWVLLAGLAAWAGYRDLIGGLLFPYAWLQWAAVAVIAMDVPFFFFLRSRATPGAGDNLVSSCLLIKLAELLKEKKDQGLAPRHTRVLFVSFDAEEAGLRGSRAFARQYKRQLREIPTYNVNLESLFDLKKLEYLVSDINGTVRLSQKLAKSLQEVTKSLGYTSRLFPMRHGYGATDAAELAKIGVQATTLAALSPDIGSGNNVYHTHNDDVQHLDPKVIRAALEILNAFLVKKEQELETAG